VIKSRWPARLAIAVVVLSLAGAAVGWWLQFDKGEEDMLGQAALGVAFLAFAVVGAVMIAKRPGHRLGWLFSGIGVYALLGNALVEYSDWAVRTGGSTGQSVLGSIVFTWYGLFTAFGVFVPLLYPTGQPPSRRWWGVGWLGAAAATGLTLLQMLQETICVKFDDLTDSCIQAVRNPIGFPGVADPERSFAGDVFLRLLLVSLVLALASVVVRFVRSRGVERLQLKWFTYAVGLLAGQILLIEILPVDILGIAVPGTDLLVGLLIAFLPVSAGIAIFRYRLYEIDRLISRTFTYALLVAVLAAVYATGVVGLQAVLPVEGSDLAVAGSTLAAFTLFQPLRRRVKRWMDRRFNRSRYQAARTVEEFGARLRDAVDLDCLTTDLATVVGATLEPAGIRLILKEPSR
jgi:hypothetical protein